MCDCVLLVSLSFLAGLLGVCFLSRIQECLPGRGCAVPLLFGPALLTLLHFQGAGIDAPGIQQIFIHIQVYLGEKDLPSCAESAKRSPGAPACPALGRGAVLGWVVPPILLTQKLLPGPCVTCDPPNVPS